MLTLQRRLGRYADVKIGRTGAPHVVSGFSRTWVGDRLPGVRQLYCPGFTGKIARRSPRTEPTHSSLPI
jgi:hypothetical protein